jgi:predicted phage-related endonuclease
VRWRGSFKTRVHDLNDNTFQILPNLICADAQRLHAVRSHPQVASFVSLRVLAEFVAESVYFNCKSSSLAKEVENEWTEWMLPSELKAVRTQSQFSPEPDLGRAHTSAKLTSLMN